jgi:hypothetical protein
VVKRINYLGSVMTAARPERPGILRALITEVDYALADRNNDPIDQEFATRLNRDRPNPREIAAPEQLFSEMYPSSSGSTSASSADHERRNCRAACPGSHSIPRSCGSRSHPRTANSTDIMQVDDVMCGFSERKRSV